MILLDSGLPSAKRANCPPTLVGIALGVTLHVYGRGISILREKHIHGQLYNQCFRAELVACVCWYFPRASCVVHPARIIAC